MTTELITEADLARILRLNLERTADLRRREEWPHIKIGRAYRYTPEQVEHIIRSHIVRPGPPEMMIEPPGSGPG